MRKSFWIIVLTALVIVPMAVVGCKGKVEKAQSEAPAAEYYEATSDITPAGDSLAVTEPAQSVATETIPPTAAPEIASKPAPAQQTIGTRAKDIQRALKNAGFYAGAIDGKIGPKSKKAIEDFQSAKGLKVDGKVGPKTWAELEKYLTQ